MRNQFSENILKFIYGENVDIKIVSEYDTKFVYDDIIENLSGGDITKQGEILEMPHKQVFKTLESKMRVHLSDNKIKPHFPKMGFDIGED